MEEPSPDAKATLDGKGKLRTTFHTLRAFGGKVGGAVGGTVAHAAKSGMSVVDKVKDIPSNLIDNGGDGVRRIASLMGSSQPKFNFPKEKLERDKVYSQREWEAAEKRADEVLEQLFPGYFEAEFDPVEHELKQLSSEDGPDKIDDRADVLTTAEEKATGKLSRHVFKKRDQLLAGITAVDLVQDDLKAAFLTARSCRSNLRQSSEEIMRNVRVAGQTRRKQHYLDLLQVCSRIQRAQTLQQSLRQALEMGEYGEAILLCMESFQGVEDLQGLKVSSGLRAAVQRQYVHTLARVDAALATICTHFEPSRYSKVLEAYVLQGTPADELGDKVLRSFLDSIVDATDRVVRSLLMTKPSVAEHMAVGGHLEGSYPQLCNSLPVELLLPCLVQLMEVLFDTFSSYHVMAQWHTACIQQQQQEQTQGDGMLTVHADDPQQRTILGFLSRVGAVLSSSRADIFDMAILRVTEVLNIPATFRGRGFVQAVQLERTFLAAGEAFMGCEATELRAALQETSTTLFSVYHHSNMETLSKLLHKERWCHVPQADVEMGMKLQELVLLGLQHSTPWSKLTDQQRSFEGWLRRGNPFAKGSDRGTGTPHQSATAQLPSAAAIPSAPPSAVPAGAVSGPAEAPGSGTTLVSVNPPAPWSASSQHKMIAPATKPDSEPQPSNSSGSWTRAAGAGAAGAAMPTQQQAVDNAANNRSRTRQQGDESSSNSNSSGGAVAVLGLSASGPTITLSSGQVLRSIRAYGQLLRSLPSLSVAVFQAMCELLDHLLLSCFICFGGVTLETLVLQENVLPTRLQNTILRILTMPNSQFKNAVEELLRMKPLMSARTHSTTPAPSAALGTNATGISFIDRFAVRMESLATNVEKSVDRMQQRLNAQVQAIQMPAAISSIAGELSTAIERVNALGASAVGAAKPSGDGYGLHERIAASEALIHVAAELKAAHTAILSCTPQPHHREVDVYFSPHGTVEAVQDLRDALFRGAAAKLLMSLVDEERGIAPSIAATNYNLPEPLTAPSVWSTLALRAYSQFRSAVTEARLPHTAVIQIWEHAMSIGAEALVDGLSRIRRCSFEGRASMSYDLSHLERGVRALAPAGLSGTFRSVEAYIKAFYLPWEELDRWCQVHLAEYGRLRILSLIEVIADAYTVPRAQKTQLLNHINTFSREFNASA